MLKMGSLQSPKTVNLSICCQPTFAKEEGSAYTKWHPTLDATPEEDRAKSIKNLDIREQGLPLEKAVGIQWCLESDNLTFRIVVQDKPLTRRGMLSTVSLIFDPLGLILPFLLIGKQILQNPTRMG